MCRNQTVTDAFTGVGTCPHGGIHSAGFTAHQHGDIAATHEFATDKLHFRCLAHGIRRFDCRNQTTCFDHTQCDSVVFSCHFVVS